MQAKKLHTFFRLVVFFLLCVLLCALAGNRNVAKEAARVQAPVSGTVVSRQTVSTASVPLLEREGFDIILLIDGSGSMKHSDPRNYRKDAAKLFISLIGKDDRIGIMIFGDAAVRLIPLTPNTEEGRPALFKAVDMISSKEFSTNIFDAVRKGLDDLLLSSRKNRILIMMSDGKLALGTREKDEAAFTGLMTLLPELRYSGIKLYTVAFTDESDSALLESLAEETGGFFRFAKTDRDVHRMFASIFEKIKTPDSVPFTGESFNIDADIKEAIVLVTKKPGTTVVMTDPAGIQHTGSLHAASLQWYASSIFDMITIREPRVGIWTVKLSVYEGNKVYVLTNLNLKCSFDRSFVTKGETVRIDTWLEKQGVIVTEKKIMDNAAFSAEITGPDAKIVKLSPIDAVRSDTPGHDDKHAIEFSAVDAGEYSVKIMAEGKTFRREKNLQFKVVDAPVPSKTVEKPMPAIVPVNAATASEISWARVLFQFSMINLAAGAMIAIVYFIRKTVKRKKARA